MVPLPDADRDAIPERVSGESERPPLIGTLPVAERGELDPEDEQPAHGIDEAYMQVLRHARSDNRYDGAMRESGA